MSVKRYGLHMCGTLAEKADGEYVKASDYDALKTERDLLLAIRDAADAYMKEMNSPNPSKYIRAIWDALDTHDAWKRGQR